jgi:phosphoserine aminotransferase
VSVYNFCAGPAMLPPPVLETVRAELLDWQGSGLSVMEVSHRGAAFQATAAAAEADLRTLLAIPDHYRVLFLHGGATQQFAAIPLNLSAAGDTVDYVDTGIWSSKAIAEARRHARVNVVASSADGGYRDVPALESIDATAGARYLHYTPNETIGGVEFPDIPTVDPAVPLVADLSSTILSQPFDVSRHGLIYAGAQKNIGPAGLAVVIVREDLLGRARHDVPPLMDYTVEAREGSMLNTPPTFAWYLAGLVFRWLIAEGGVAAMATRNAAKSALLYGAIDGSNGFYRNTVAHRARSRMNVPFQLSDPRLDRDFIDGAREAGLVNLEGHRLAGGGMRASLYNAMPLEGVMALVEFMRAFAQRYG